MNRHSRILVVLLLLVPPACATQDGASTVPAGDAPALVILEHSYFGGGFDAPLLAALPDGRVLIRRLTHDNASLEYSVFSLSASGRDSLLTTLGIRAVGALPDSLYDYNPGWTDQHSYYVVLASRNGRRVIQLRAALMDGDSLRPDVPAALRAMFRQVRELASRPAPVWTPDSVEVAIWPYEYAPDNPPLQWPSEWPSLSDSRWSITKDEFVNEVRSLRLPSSAIPRLDSLLNIRRTRQALAISGKKWAFGYRWVFPLEEHWLSLANRLEG